MGTAYGWWGEDDGKQHKDKDHHALTIAIQGKRKRWKKEVKSKKI